MRVITLRPPWSWAVIHGGKDIENRRTNIAGDYRGPLAIHTGLRYDRGWDSPAMDDAMRPILSSNELRETWPWEQPRGHIIGVVDLIDVHAVANPHFNPICFDHRRPNGLAEAAAEGRGVCSRWADPGGQWHLVLANPTPLETPIPYRGHLGIRRADPLTMVRLMAQIDPEWRP